MGDKKTNDLLFFVFGIEENDDEREKIEACMDRAYLDLCRTLKFKYSTKQLSEKEEDASKNKEKEDFKNNKEDFKTKVKNTIRESLDPLNANRFDCNKGFDEWHENTIRNIIRKIKCSKNVDIFKEDFTVGHAQKWLNMTLKYMLIMGILPEEWEEFLHIPLDDYILKAAYNEFNVNRNNYNVNGNNYKIDKWSKIKEYDNYLAYQKRIREQVKNQKEKLNGGAEKKYKSPAQWESEAWIREAKKRAYTE